MKNLMRYAIALPLVGLILVPGVSSAQSTSVSALQAQIAALLAEIQTLQQQLTVAESGSGATWCHVFNTNLEVGSAGSEVTALQTALSKDGESVSVSGTFDEKTASAVTAFQQKYASQVLTPNGLSNGTGYAGPSTRAKLNLLFSCTTTGTVPQPQPVPVPPVACPSWGCNGPVPIEPVQLPIPVTTSTTAVAPSVTLTTSPSSVTTAGGPVTLSWSSKNTTSCSGNSSWAGQLPPSGSTVFNIGASTNVSSFGFGITCFGPLGTAVASTNVAVGANNANGPVTISIDPGTMQSGSLIGGTNDDPVTEFDLTAGANAATITNLGIEAMGSNSTVNVPMDLEDVSLWNSNGTLLYRVSPVVLGSNKFPVNITIPANTTQKFWIKASSALSGIPGDTVSAAILSSDVNGPSLSVSGSAVGNPQTITQLVTALPAVTVIAPTSGVTWAQGSAQVIRWETDGTGNPADVGINLLQNGNNIAAIGNVPNNGAFSWVVPTGLSGSNFQIQIYGNGGYGESPDFSIQNITLVPLFTVSQTSVNSGGSLTFAWNLSAAGSSGQPEPVFDIETCPSGVTMYDVTNAKTFLCGDLGRAVAWSGSDTIQFTSTNNAPVQMTGILSNGVGGAPFQEQQNFTVNPGTTTYITVIAPNGGETLPAGSNETIQWTPNNSFGPTVPIYLLLKSGISFYSPLTINSAAPNTGSYTWTVPSSVAAGSNYYVQVGCWSYGFSSTNSCNGDISNAAFTISNPYQTQITALSPFASTTLQQGEQFLVEWSAPSALPTVTLNLLQNDLYLYAIATVPNTGLYTWTVPSNYSGSGFQMYVTAAGYLPARSGAFSITP